MRFNKLIKQILEGCRKKLKIRKGEGLMSTRVERPSKGKGSKYKRPRNKRELD